MPKSVLGISALILAFSLGASLSGVVAYSYYTYRLTNTENKVNAALGTFGNTAKSASAAIKAQQDAATAQIQTQLAPIQKLAAEGATLQALVVKSAPALYFVHTLDQARPAVGRHRLRGRQRQPPDAAHHASTPSRRPPDSPGPRCSSAKTTTTTRRDGVHVGARADLALIILPTGNQPRLDFAAQQPASR